MNSESSPTDNKKPQLIEISDRKPEEKREKSASPAENCLTISTKLSTDQLICKTPRDSSRNSPPTPLVRRSVSNLNTNNHKDGGESGSSEYLNGIRDGDSLVYLGLLQMLFGGIMVIFGVLALVHEANLSQLCGGIWGGCVALTAGLLALGAAARDCCPLRQSLARLALTGHLALSLIALAIANLILVFAAIGIVRDSNRTDVVFFERQIPSDNTTSPSLHDEPFEINSNWAALLANMGLLIACTCECIAAAISAWKCARIQCACFRPYDSDKVDPATLVTAAASGNPKDVLVSAWLGKQPLSGSNPALAVTATPVGANPRAPSSASTKLSPRRSTFVGSSVVSPTPVYMAITTTPKRKVKQLIPAPLFSIPPPPPVIGYPVMGAPPPTYLMPPHVHRRPAQPNSKNRHGSYDNIYRKRKRYPSDQELQHSTLPHYLIEQEKRRREKRHRNREQRRTITEEDVVRTYTGLDRTIAEQFIVRCDSTRNQHSVASKSDEGTTSGSAVDTSLSLTNSDLASNEYFLEKL